MIGFRTLDCGFSLIELLVAATIFTFVVTGVSGLFTGALDIQRRATAIQKIDENVQFVLESLAREVRVSTITSGDTDCATQGPATSTLTIDHPVNGTVTYGYQRLAGSAGRITRDDGAGPEPITAEDVDFLRAAFCVTGSGNDDQQARLTVPLEVTAVEGRTGAKPVVRLQTTVVSRDLSQDLQ
jgi:prepilin-type N-terminal cleavage/methylation domain-containing protein